MKLGTFEYHERRFLGVALDNGVADVSDIAQSMLEFLEAGEVATEQVRKLASKMPPESLIPYSQVRVCAPIDNPRKVVCIGLNYRDHANESGAKMPSEPVFFSKFATALIGPEESIKLPRVSQQVDYEAELAVIVGKRGKNIDRSRAFEYVAGYTAFNDVSARDLQMRDGQWIKGKALDTFAPLGPYLVMRDEIPDPHKLAIRLWLNGSLMQNSSTQNLIFGIPQVIEYLSQLFTLEPGDIIATGTPSGVGFVRKPPVFLKPGDEVTVEVERIGRLTNKVVGAQASSSPRRRTRQD